MLEVERLRVTVYRAPVDAPVVAAMGVMTDRPALLIELVDRDGVRGFGEVWCNFPTCGAEHRARLIGTFLGPLLLGRRFSRPADAFEHLSSAATRLVLQSGEPGPLAQAIAGLDAALHDLAARRAGLPLWRHLAAQAAEGASGPKTPAQAAEGASGPENNPAQAAEGGSDSKNLEGASGPENPGPTLPAYASGINPDAALAQALAAHDAGYRAFKLKIGFGRTRDLANLEALRAALGPEVPIAVDANQAYDLAEALEMSQAIAGSAPLWLEEPLAVDRPDHEWLHLARTSPVPLAGGENLRGRRAFDHAIRVGALRYLQPDVGKWGGLSGCLRVARAARAAGRTYCPHWLGGGIGLLASAHLLAATGGDGMLEVDCNPNPLRTGLAMPFPALRDGRLALDERPGLGVEPEPAMDRYRTLVVDL